MEYARNKYTCAIQRAMKCKVTETERGQGVSACEGVHALMVSGEARGAVTGIASCHRCAPAGQTEQMTAAVGGLRSWPSVWRLMVGEVWGRVRFASLRVGASEIELHPDPGAKDPTLTRTRIQGICLLSLTFTEPPTGG